jgi:hypothetical protein
LNFLFIKNPTRQQKGMFVFWVFLGGKGLFEGFEEFEGFGGFEGFGVFKRFERFERFEKF